MNNEERERIERARRERKKRKRKSRMAGRIVIFVALLAVLGVLVFAIMHMERFAPLIGGDAVSSSSSAAASFADAGDGMDGGATELVGSAGGSSEGTASSTDEISSGENSVAGVSSEASAAGGPSGAAILDVEVDFVPSTKEEALAKAQEYAVQYDYDRAVAVIRSYSGYENDSDLMSAIDGYTADKAACYAVDVTRVPHIFFHSLLNDDRGLIASVVGEDRAIKNDAAMTTAAEFDAMIGQMYEAGYVLVSLDDLCIKTKNADGTTSVQQNNALLLPEGKKAFVLSDDDLSYYHTYGEGTQGYATKMVLDADGKVKCEYTNENGETLIGDYDVVPRLDTFIEEHPDFAYHGARGTVALTGYNGVFGYRTNDYYKDINNPKLDKDQVEWLRNHPEFNWEEDVASATAIANAMKAEGWTFASHTYGHWNASTHTAEELQADNERWMTVNHNIVGDIDKIIFAFGGDIGGVEEYNGSNPKFAYFRSQGYVIFCNVDGHAGWTDWGPDYMRTGRVPLDGFSMYQAMTEEGGSHATYAASYDILGIHDIADFFDKNRITPIESE